MYYEGQRNTEETVRRPAEVIQLQHLALTTDRACRARPRRYCDVLGGLPHHLPPSVQPPAPEVKGFMRQNAKRQGLAAQRGSSEFIMGKSTQAGERSAATPQYRGLAALVPPEERLPRQGQPSRKDPRARRQATTSRRLSRQVSWPKAKARNWS